MKIKRGDIFLADLGEGYGSEQGGIRPVLVVQNNKGNKHSHTLLVACIPARLIQNTICQHITLYLKVLVSIMIQWL